MKTIVIYHKNCFDGICAAWIAYRTIKPHPELIPMAYGDNLDLAKFDKDTNVFVLDFSFPRTWMLRLDELVNSLLVLDHHKTAQENCQGLSFCQFDMNESGASLAWKHFCPSKPIPPLVAYIRDRDLWKFEMDNSEIINSFIQSFPMDVHEYEMLHQKLNSSTGMLEANLGGKAIARYKYTMVKAMCKNAAFSSAEPFFNNKIPIVNASILFSEVGHELCIMYPNAPFAAYYFDRLADNKRQWGLRSIGDYDVSKVAKNFGGGGHKNAAGFETSLSEI